MRRQLVITTDPIDEASLARQSDPTNQAGAVLRFLGVVRGMEDGRSIRGIEYEAFREMAEHQFGLLFDTMEKRWPIHSVRLIHRTGFVAAGEPSLWVEITAGHRGEAFAACQYLIDEMKRLVPIWKKAIPD
jgi:molybdopterin synthase catalytic subunit